MDDPHSEPAILVRRPLRRGLLAPTLAALTVRLALLVVLPIAPAWDGIVYAHAADRMAEGEGFTRHAIDPLEPTTPTAFYPVGFPALLVPLRWIGGGRTLDPFLQSLLGAAIVPVVGLLGRRTGGARVGRLAAWITALWPGGVLLSLSWLSEPAFCLLAALASLVVASSRRRARGRAILIASVLLSVAAYLRPVALPMLALLVFGVALASARSVRTRARVFTHLALRAAIVASCVLAPWAIRSSHALGGAVLLSTNGGSNFLIGTIGEGVYDPIPSALECHATDELEADHCRAARALERIRTAPLDALARALLKLAHTFGHDSAPAQAWASALRAPDPAVRESAALLALGLSRVAWLALLALSLAGAALSLRRERTIVHTALFAPPLAIALTHTLMLGGDRYHAPAAASMAVLAAVAWTLWRRSAQDMRS
jgi:4-amino-4-deoxy-L-arabinose transferase-like glycosyltransferase